MPPNNVSQRIVDLNREGHTIHITPSITEGTVLTGGGDNGTRHNSGQGLGGALNNGLVPNRVSIHRYNLGVGGGYELTPTTTLTGTYNYTSIIFSQSQIHQA